MKIQVLIVRPGRLPEEAEVDNRLEAMRQIVGGSIDFYRLDTSTMIVCNANRNRLGLKPCLPVDGDILAGTLIVCRNVRGNVKFRSLEAEQLKIWKHILSSPVCRGCGMLEDGSFWEELKG